MVTRMEILAVIPARGGSKGFPGKNLALLNGHPLLAWSIEAAKISKSVTRCIVSTDCEKIAEAARRYGAETPFLRPPELARDDSTDLEAFVHALQWLKEKEGYHPDAVVQIRPTSPLRPQGLVDAGVSMLLRTPEADSVRCVVRAAQNPYKMWSFDPETSFLTPLLRLRGIPEPFNAPRQSLPAAFWQTGHLDVIRSKVIVEDGSMSGKNILGLEVKEEYAVDIDSRRDLERAEQILRNGTIDVVRP